MTKPKTLDQLRVPSRVGPVDKVAYKPFLW